MVLHHIGYRSLEKNTFNDNLIPCYSIFTECAFHRVLHQLNLQIKQGTLVLLGEKKTHAAIYVCLSGVETLYNILLRLKRAITSPHTLSR